MRSFKLLALTAALSACASPALAGLFDDLYQGLGYYARPSSFGGTPVAGGGLQNGSQFGRLRIVPNMLGNGYQLQLDRSFGPDSTGRPETFNFGFGELSLQGQTQTTLGYTRRGLLGFDGTILANNLAYNLQTKIGAQDATLTGVINVSEAFRVNQLGFYTLSLNASNSNSTLTLDGALVNDPNIVTNWTLGPISVKGNIFVDAAAAVATSLGADPGDIERIFPDSPSAQIDAAIRENLASQSKQLTAAEAASLRSEVAGLQAQILPSILGNLMGQAALAGGNGPPTLLPEPGALLMLSIGITAMLARRRG